jgi:hydrogenase maturation protease
MRDSRVLIIGIGNSSRGDDGLGWKFVDNATAWRGIDLEYRYQLQVEDAGLIRDYQKVIFVDASVRPLPEGFAFNPCVPEKSASFTTHRLEPGAVLWLCRELYQATPEAYTMAIEGEQFQLGQPLSKAAQRNLARAMEYMDKWYWQNLRAHAADLDSGRLICA